MTDTGFARSDELTPASAIETDFPVERLNRLAELEAYNKHHYRPTNYQHKWWARRLGSVFRAITIGALSDPGVDADEQWKRYAQSQSFDALVFDPFMGGGTTGQEATRTGARFVGSDLNPVAWFVSRMGLADQPDDLDTAYSRVVEGAREEIDPYFRTRCPDCESVVSAAFYLWVREGTYEHEGETRRVRDFDSLAVDRESDGRGVVACPDRDCGALTAVADPAEAACGACGRTFDATGEADLPMTRLPAGVDSDAVDFEGGDGTPRYVPYAVKHGCEACGDGFAAFDEFDAERLRAARERLEATGDVLPIPEQEIPDGEKTGDLHARGYARWRQLFSDRQLLALGALLREIRAVEDDLARRYLTLTFSASLEFNNQFCSYKGADPSGPGAVRHIFSHHAYVHPREPLENNPLGAQVRQSGTFRYLYEYRLQKALSFQRDPVERILGEDGTVSAKRSVSGQVGGARAESAAELLEGDATHRLHCGDSTDLPFADAIRGAVDAVVTDPPYYDSVQYGELADFFYVWLREALREDFPAAFASETVLKGDEAVGNSTRGTSLDDYRDMLAGIFERAGDLLAPDAPLVFTFHHRDAAVWGALLEAIDAADFRVVATYPVRGENRLSVHINGQRAIQLDSVIVCRLGHKRSSADWSVVRDEIERRARERLGEFRTDGGDDLSRLDAGVVVRGACMTAYSRYESVSDDDGLVDEREAMGRIQPLIETLNDTTL